MLTVETTAAYTTRLVEKPHPTIGENGVLLKMARVGVCGSDTQIFHGQHKVVTFPLVQGHEGSAVVVDTGASVTNVKPGDKVVVFPLNYCGTCYACKKGAYNVCEAQRYVGIHEDGLFAEYFATQSHNVLKVHQDMSLDMAAFVEPAAVGVAAALRAGVVPGIRIAIIGAGPIGNFTAQACQAMGAQVLLCDLEQSKLDFARAKGIHHIANTGETSLAQAIDQSFGGGRADVIIDCVGIAPTLHQAIDASANSSVILVVGNFKQPVEIEIPRLQRREVDLKGLFLYKVSTFETAIDLLHRGKIDIEGMITAHFPLQQLHQAFLRIDNDPASVMKILIDL